MQEMWNQRYSEKDFVYGKEPNQFFKEQIEKLIPGKILLLGEGDGRNSVFAAKLGWQVDAFDFSETAKQKALKFAESENVSINYEIADLQTAELKENFYDAVGIIYLHLPEEIREIVNAKAQKSLIKNGFLIFEAYEKDQIKNTSGGPKDVDLLYSLEDIFTDFQDLEIQKFNKENVFLNEGPLHTGVASIIRFAGKKE
ncbi:MAG: methyltransferase domain-containing protein [Bacteroidetes bacterium]|nr:methyltransferase domain-containing protein [Bacteroidota bacterium]